MTATNYTFQCEQGANFEEVITWKDAEGNPVSNSGYTARMQVRKEPNSDVAVSLTTENSKITLGGVNGQVQLLLNAAATEALVAADYLYDLEMVSDSGEVSRILEGIFSVSSEITKS